MTVSQLTLAYTLLYVKYRASGKLLWSTGSSAQSLVLCDDLEGWDRGREALEGGGMCIHTADPWKRK